MDPFPSLGTAPLPRLPPPTNNGGMSAAERLMALHENQQKNDGGHAHLSYEEMRQAGSALLNQETSPGSSSQPTQINGSQHKKKQPDIDSETAFPSLGTPSAAPKTSGGWGSGPALSARLQLSGGGGAHLSKTGVHNGLPAQTFTETLVLFLSSIHIGPVPPQFREKGPRQAGAKREEDPKTLPDVLRAIQRRHPTVSVESSTSRDRVTILFRTPYTLPPITSSTPPLIRVAHGLNPEERIVRARQELITRVTRKIEKVVMVPSHVKPFIIGQKGRILKSIIESTGASVNMPPKDDTLPEPLSSPDGPTEDIELIPITITGEESAVLDAEERIKLIVKERTNKVHLKIDSVPIDFYPILDGSDSKLTTLVQRALIEKHGIKEEDLNCRVIVPNVAQLRKAARSHICLADGPAEEDADGDRIAEHAKDSHIVVSGEREQAEVAVKLVQNLYEDLLRKTTKVEFELPKRQHRFLDAPTLEEILLSTGSIVTLPPASDPSEKVVIRGEKMANVQALGLVMTAANTKEVDSLDLKTLYPKLSDAQQYAQRLMTYLSARWTQTKLKQIQDGCGDKVKIYLPLPSTVSTSIEMVGEEIEAIQKVKETVVSYFKTSLKPEYFDSVEVDYLLHRQLSNKKNPKLKLMQEQRGIELLIPSEKDKSSTIILSAARLSASAKSVNKDEDLVSNLNKVKEEIMKIIKDLANIQTRQVEIAQKFHSYVLGPNGTTLNAIIGEEKLVSVEVGGVPRNGSSDLITIRGTKDEVERVEKEIKRIAEEAKVNDTINSYTTEFEVESKHVSHLVGRGGSTVVKLREELGVRVDFSDQSVNENDGTSHHKKKRTQTKVSIVIQGRKENVEEAKKRILAQTERLADEVTVSLPLLSGLDRRSLVGKGGKYVTRLQDLHLVHINMPRAPSDEAGGSVSDGGDSIIIRGPKKGVEAVRKELVELMAYEKEHSNTLTLSISSKSISRIVGKGGAQAEKIKEDSGIMSMDIDKVENANGLSQVVLKGTKPSILAAKKMINSIAQEVDDESSVNVVIDKAYHQTLIGRGGARLRELVKQAGGEDDDARFVKFPKPYAEGESANTVTIKGSKKLVPKIKQELEAEVERLKAQVVYGVRIPRGSQPGLIGRGANGLKALQTQFKVMIHAPGWKEWAIAPDPINLAELNGVEQVEIFKVVGSTERCLAAMEDMKAKTKAKENIAKVSKTVLVPSVLFHQVSQNGRFFRDLPRNLRIDHGNVPTPTPFKISASILANAESAVPTTRIDVDDDSEEVAELGWTVQEIVESPNGSGEAEIPWNIHGPTIQEVERVAQMIEDRMKLQKSPPTHLAIAKVPGRSMAKIIGRGGSGLQMMIEESEGATIDVIGRSGSDRLSVIGSLDQLETVKRLLLSRLSGR